MQVIPVILGIIFFLKNVKFCEASPLTGFVYKKFERESRVLVAKWQNKINVFC